MAEVGALRITIGLNSAGVTQGIQDLNLRLRALNSEYKTVSTGSAKLDNSLETLRTRADTLTRTMQVHRAKVEELRQKYEQSKATKGEDAQETIRLAAAYNNAVAAMNRTEGQLQQVNSRIEEQTSEFKQLERTVNTSVDGITRQLRVLDSGFDAATAGSDGLENSIEQLRNKSQHLSQTLNLQQDRVRELSRLHQASATATGADSAATQELQIRLNRATQQMRETESRLQQTTNEIQQQTSAWNRLRQNVNNAGDRMTQVGGKMQSMGSEISQSFGVAFLAVGAGLGLTAKKAIDFESQMSSVKSVMSPDEVNQFGKSLEDLAMKMGNETKFSAMEAALGIEELIKAGVTVTDIVGGGLEGALSLAVAGELELADAAEVASTALNAFKKDNLSVMDAADLLAGAANASATSVSEMKFSLAMVSAVASGVGLSFKDTTTALAAFANNGLKGSDAGTSLKTMLLNLSPSTDGAATAMAELGLMTEQGTSAFYDANGSIKSMADIAELLKTKLAHLTDEQRQMALKTMFGTDAIRAANILYKEGATGITNMADAMTKIKSADVAATKLDNVKGKIQLLKGTLETTAISLGNSLLPAIEKVVAKVEKMTKWFNSLSDETKQTIMNAALVTAGITGITAAFGIGLTVLGGAISGFGALTSALGGTLGAITLLSGPVGWIAAGLGLATVATAGLMSATKKKTEATVEDIEKSFESLEARQKEIEINEELIKNFDSLRSKNKLSNDEMLRFLDINSELAQTASPDQIAALHEEQGKLLEKSGLTNEEMKSFLEYNDLIIEKAPKTNKAISDQGNAFATNSAAIKQANDEKIKSLKIDSELAISKSIEKEIELREKSKELGHEISKQYQEQEQTYKNINQISGEVKVKQEELAKFRAEQQKKINANDLDGALIAQRKAETTERELITLEGQLSKEKDKLETILTQLDIKQKSKELTDEEIKKLDEQKYKYESLVLSAIGLTAEKGKGLQTIQTEIQKLEEQKGIFKGLLDAGKLNTSEYQDQVGALDQQIGKLKSAQTELENVNQLAGKTVYKSIQISTNPSIDEFERRITKPGTKVLNITTSGGGRALGGYATGTRYAPAGEAWVGEKGRELMYTTSGGFALVSGPSLLNLPLGARVIPNRDTEKILQNWNIPKLSGGGVTIKEGWAIAGERGREIVDLTGAMTSPLSNNNGSGQPMQINITPAPVILEGQKIGEIVFDTISDLQNSQFQTKLILNGMR
ncbi:phage tail tape measure protein [Neobacillus niacini]|uniref:phage tail tape measure protein n=1 Tax=Neobacillus niacini TaxID=86668 RepID=UPI002FFDE4FD